MQLVSTSSSRRSPSLTSRLSSRLALDRRGIVQSMNRPGQMNDNAHMESFFHSMKTEYLWGKQFDSDDDLRQTLHTYL
jgi:transposase InsO family protein